MASVRWGAAAICALAAACGGGGGGAAQTVVDDGGDVPAAPPQPPIAKDGFTFYGAAQGLPPDIWDVSADEGGNVYVAANDVVLAKRRDEASFRSFDAASAALTRNCDEQGTKRRLRRRGGARRGGDRAAGSVGVERDAHGLEAGLRPSTVRLGRRDVAAVAAGGSDRLAPRRLAGPAPGRPVRLRRADPRWMDAVSSLSFCDDGTLWIASWIHGLARRSKEGTISYVDLPDGHGNSASAVACDPSDGSIWLGFVKRSFGRYDGGWWTIDGIAPPSFVVQSPVRNIQIDRWTSPRIVYFAHMATRFGPAASPRTRGPDAEGSQPLGQADV